MVYVAIAMALWFMGVTVATLWGMAISQKPTKFDTLIGFIIGPIMIFVSLFIVMWKMSCSIG